MSVYFLLACIIFTSYSILSCDKFITSSKVYLIQHIILPPLCKHKSILLQKVYTSSTELIIKKVREAAGKLPLKFTVTVLHYYKKNVEVVLKYVLCNGEDQLLADSILSDGINEDQCGSM